MNSARNYWFDSIIIVAIILSASVAYLPLWSNGFVTWDTAEYVLQNPNIKTFSFSTVSWMFTAFHLSNWHPLTWISHAIDYQLYGLNPTGHLITNLVIHILNSCLVFLIAKKIFSIVLVNPHWISAALVGVLFSVHPQHVESVAWVAQRKDVLCAFFMLSSIIFYIRFASDDNRKYRTTNYVLSCMAGLLAYLSKPMAVTLPVILLMIDIYPLGRTYLCSNPLVKIKKISIGRILIEKLPFIAMSVVVSVITFLAQHQGGSIASLESVNIGYRLVNAANSYLLYLGKFVYPFNLSPFYEYPGFIQDGFSAIDLLPLLMLVSIITLAIYFWIRGKYFWLIVVAYYLVTLLPVIGVVQIGSQAAADRYTYLPMLSVFLLLGAGVSVVMNRVNSNVVLRAGGFFTLSIVVLFSLLTIQQTKIWSNNLVFWHYTTIQSPNSGLVRANYGRTLFEIGRRDDSLKELEFALSLRESALILQWLGDAHFDAGNHLKAKGYYLLSFEVKRDGIFIKKAEIYSRLASISFAQKEIEDARQWARKALELNPGDQVAQEIVRSAS